MNKIKRLLLRLRACAPANVNSDKTMVLAAQAPIHFNREKRSIDSLAEAELSVFSQWGEDGIIDWLVHNLPNIPKTFVEFGIEDYRESNTRLLTYLRNWSGFVIDGSKENIESLTRQDIYWRHDIESCAAFISRENINDLILSSGIKGDIGLLSIDIDGNDYWVWQAIQVVTPAIVICEYNAVLGDRAAITVPYNADFQRTRAHHSNLYFGASIRALIALGSSKGYTFVGTTSTGCNAFFVRDDLAQPIIDSLSSVTAFPSSVRESRDAEGRLTFVSGVERAQIIEHLPFVDVKTDQRVTLSDISELYSVEWRNKQSIRL